MNKVQYSKYMFLNVARHLPSNQERDREIASGRAGHTSRPAGRRYLKPHDHLAHHAAHHPPPTAIPSAARVPPGPRRISSRAQRTSFKMSRNRIPACRRDPECSFNPSLCSLDRIGRLILRVSIYRYRYQLWNRKNVRIGCCGKKTCSVALQDSLVNLLPLLCFGVGLHLGNIFEREIQ